MTREILYPEFTLKLGLVRVNSCKFRVLRVDFGSKLAFSGLFVGKSISQAMNTVYSPTRPKEKPSKQIKKPLKPLSPLNPETL
jgi:hypothetical protein